jgi:hypothetical protein
LCLGFNTIAINPGDAQDKAKELTNCYYNWRLTEANFQDNSFSPMIWKPTSKKLLTVSELVIKYPSRTWYVYNEPEIKDQANVTPEIAVDWFGKTYTLIKKLDPTAKIGCCGNMIRSESVNWLNKFVALSAIKPDFWHIHIYAADAKTTTWKSFLDGWWGWNSENWNLDTVITETCGAYALEQTDLIKFVNQYRHPKLLKTYWFSAYEESIDWECHLLNDDGSLTSLGKAWQELPKVLTPEPEPTPTNTPTITKTPTLSITPQPFETLIPTSTQVPTNLGDGIEPTLEATPSLIPSTIPTTVPIYYWFFPVSY